MRNLENIDIHRVMEHWECFVNGKFVCSGDTLDEIYETLIEICRDE